MGSRSSVAPSAEEVALDMKLCRKSSRGEVKATQDIRPFTRVAVCAGRVYSDDEHTRLFGDTDAWGQWTVVKQPDKQQPIKKGFIVSPGLPGGALDPLYDNPDVYGLASFFADTQPGVEPVCIYVINARKGRMEYWTGRNGALKNEKLTLCYDEEARCPKFPTVYVLYGQSSRPTSVFELAHNRTGLDPYSILRRYADYNVARRKDAASIKRWAKAYSPHLPTKLPAAPSHYHNNNNGSVVFFRNEEDRLDTKARLNQYRSNLYAALHTTHAQMRNTEQFPVSQRMRQAVNFVGTKYLGKLIRRKCSRLSALSDGEVYDLLTQHADLYGIPRNQTFSIKDPAYKDPVVRLLMMELNNNNTGIIPELQRYSGGVLHRFIAGVLCKRAGAGNGRLLW